MSAPEETLVKPGSIERFLDELLEAPGRARRARAAQKLRDELDVAAAG